MVQTTNQIYFAYSQCSRAYVRKIAVYTISVLPVASWFPTPSHHQFIWHTSLVGGFEPSENWSIGMILPNIWENHQPDFPSNPIKPSFSYGFPMVFLYFNGTSWFKPPIQLQLWLIIELFEVIPTYIYIYK